MNFAVAKSTDGESFSQVMADLGLQLAHQLGRCLSAWEMIGTKLTQFFV